MDDSPLGRLSPELRNHIYSFVFADTRLVVLSDHNSDLFQDAQTKTCRLVLRESLALSDDNSDHFQDALTKTCRQVRSETLLLDYGHVKVFPDDNSQANFRYWLRIGARGCCEFQGIGDLYASVRTVKALEAYYGIQAEVTDGLERLPKRELSNTWRQSVRDALRAMGLRFRVARIRSEHGDIYKVIVKMPRAGGLQPAS